MARVLAVDDEPTILRLLQLNLELEGHDVLTATDGSSGLEAIRRERPQVALLDVMMPNLDGLAVCATVRGDDDPVLAATPIVMLSARAREVDVHQGMLSGADAYVTKPFDPVELLAVIDRLTRPDTAPAT